ELVIVIGARCHDVVEDQALAHVFGYTIMNDVSVRDYQRRTSQWTLGKNFDGSGPMGPAIVTADELPAGARGLGIRTRLNGELLQDGNTADMVFPVPRIVALLSQVMTLEPGDVIATGTPSGVGHARRPPLWMKPGDVVTCEIDGIGTLSNPIVDAVEAR
ncbi:MAG: 5-oxopent-3-ene-1,2,5-tricarboxylate decarboxylase, partial [Geminicoccaceae bacterium]|nr:5-oxopent-3-ene-1,2,5-tricarboxylate decarboxylase [Geminicoccaceae bacterium]